MYIHIKHTLHTPYTCTHMLHTAHTHTTHMLHTAHMCTHTHTHTYTHIHSGLQPVTVVIDFTGVGPSGLQLLYPYGFEVECSGSPSLLEGTAVKVDGDTAVVQFPSCPGGDTPSAIYYCWRTDPCIFKMCPIYSEQLPSPPFYLTIASGMD